LFSVVEAHLRAMRPLKTNLLILPLHLQSVLQYCHFLLLLTHLLDKNIN
jgi:hypothetical protein